MKEKINEHDFTKNMMSIIRGGYKAKLITEVEGDVNQNQQLGNQNNDNQETTNDDLGPFPLLYKLSPNYFKLPENDNRFKTIKEQVESLGAGAIVTDIYLSTNGDLVVFGKLSLSSGELQFAMPYLDGKIKKDSEGAIEGDEDDHPIGLLQGYLNVLKQNASKTQELMYDEKFDKELLKNKEQ
jgi:hypothetical protein